MNYMLGSYKLSLKYHKFTPSSFKDIGISKSVFVAKTQFLCGNFVYGINSLTKPNDNISLENYLFLLPVFSPYLGVLSSIRLIRPFPNMSLNISETWFNVLYFPIKMLTGYVQYQFHPYNIVI